MLHSYPPSHTSGLITAALPCTLHGCRQYVQSRGRGRASGARYVILLQRGAPREAAALERTRREVADMVAAAAQLSHHNRAALARGEPLVRGLAGRTRGSLCRGFGPSHE